METIRYSATAWGEDHCYELGDETIRYWMPVSKLSFVLNLADIVSVRRKKQTHRHFRAGFIGLFLPLVMLGPVYLREGNLTEISSGLQLFAGVAFLAGIFAVIRFRKIHTILLIKTSPGDLLGIYENENDKATFALIEARVSAGI